MKIVKDVYRAGFTSKLVLFLTYMRFIIRIKKILAVVFLFSCTPIKSHIEVFHQLPKIAKNEQIKYKVAPKLADEIKNNLQTGFYLEKIKKRLAKHNFIEHPEANIELLFVYGVDDGKVHIGSAPVYGRTGIESAHTYNNYGIGISNTEYTPSYGVVGSSSYTYTLYTRRVLVTMYDTEQKQIIYQAEAVNETTDPTSTSFEPMFDAIFKKFPQKSGTSKVITTYV